MRKFILAAALAAIVAPMAATYADPPQWAQNDRRDHRDDRRDDRRGDRHDDRRDHLRDDRRDDRRDDSRGRDDNRANWTRYDYNRPDPRYGNYDPSRYYRGGNYAERRLTRNDRIYRGQDGRYYCRRNDGTTGLIIGALAGGVLGNTLSNGNSSTLATLLGAGGGALLGKSIDSGNARCR